MSSRKIQIHKKEQPKGEDGYKTFSIRIKQKTVTKLNEIAKESNMTRNELIGMFLDHSIDNYEIIE